jgi:hypothetical protein
MQTHDVNMTWVAKTHLVGLVLAGLVTYLTHSLAADKRVAHDHALNEAKMP